jgi:hypothetical protein
MPVALAAGVVLVVLTMLVASCRQRERDRAIDLILDGRAHVALAAVHRQRRRLVSRRTRIVLAASFEDIVKDGHRPPALQMRGARPLYCRQVVRSVSPALREVACLLEGEGVSARAVAGAERLITDGASPLYGLDVDALRDELDRVRCLLLE